MSVREEEVRARNENLEKMKALLDQDECYLKSGLEEIIQPHVVKSQKLEDEIASLQTRVTNKEQENHVLLVKLEKMKQQNKELKVLREELKKLEKEKQKYRELRNIVDSFEAGASPSPKKKK